MHRTPPSSPVMRALRLLEAEDARKAKRSKKAEEPVPVKTQPVKKGRAT